MISRRGSGSGAQLDNTIDHFGGLSPLKILALPLLSKFIDLASKAFSTVMINYALLRGY